MGWRCLKELQRLLLHQNAILQLPVDDEALGLAKLNHLDLSDNGLREVPKSFFLKTQIQELWLKGTLVDRLKLKETEGFDVFMARRKSKLDKQVDSNALGSLSFSVCGLD